ncbi:filamentous hemagglutinin N-terminal domain-containing protein, partial [Helicobacter burdigaliensis]
MSIEGGKNNNVIAWGGGFNIGKDAEVRFKGSGKGYLNLDYSKNSSILAGILNGGNNNIFLVNPSGVLVTESGSINANRFVASTSAMSDADINKFRASDSASFSPVFKPNKQGDIINKGNINANKVLLIGNNVRIDGGNINGSHNSNVNNEELKKPSGNVNEELHLVGNNVFIN